MGRGLVREGSEWLWQTRPSHSDDNVVIPLEFTGCLYPDLPPDSLSESGAVEGA